MREIPQHCETTTNVPRISLRDRKSRSEAVFRNPNRQQIRKIEIDGCVITENELRKCDYLIIAPDQIERYVELKGSDIIAAIEQLKGTMEYLYGGHNKKQTEKISYVVCTHVSPAINTTIQVKKVHFKRSYNSELIVTKHLEINLGSP
ncbi:MAG: hypothetical protein ACOX5R_11290 [bacterium]|jgi:RNase P protein component